MTFFAKIQAGKLLMNNIKLFNDFLASQKDGMYEIEIKRHRNKRTLSQNAALHLYFTQLAEALNDAGFDIKKTIKKDIDIPWNAYSIKEYLWRPVQKEYLQKQSTTELDKTQDIDKIYDIVNRAISERTGVSVQFPSIESLWPE